MGKGRAKRRASDERGAALVEFALVVPLFVFLILGFIAFGLILALKQSVTQSAEEGARDAVALVFDANGNRCTTEDVDCATERERDAYEGARRGLTWLGEKCCAHVGAAPSPTNDPDAPLQVDTELIPCAGPTLAPGNTCMAVRVDYQYEGNELVPLPSGIPPFSFAIPDRIRSEAIVRVDN